jgi:hypothetical protein
MVSVYVHFGKVLATNKVCAGRENMLLPVIVEHSRGMSSRRLQLFRLIADYLSNLNSLNKRKYYMFSIILWNKNSLNMGFH